MQRKRSKARQRAKLVLIYSLMALAVLSIVTILVLVVQGYRYNRYDGKLEQGGLVQFDSFPSGATVTVDDVTLANRTASKVTLTAGQHTVSMTRDGFSTWRKQVTVKPGSVLWLNYSLLFPTSPTVSTAAQYSDIASALPSPDRKTMATLAVATEPRISLTPLEDTTPTTSVKTLPSSSYTHVNESENSFSLVAWDKDSRRLIVRHATKDTTEYISFDTRTEQAHNITTELGLTVAQIAYSLADSNTLYVRTASNELRRISIESATVSGPLATNIDSFTVGDDQIVLYTTIADEKGTRTVGYVSSGKNKAKTLATYTDATATTLNAATGTYYGDRYVAILYGKEASLYKTDLPASDSSDAITLPSPKTLTLTADAQYIGFSPKANRMLYAAKDSNVTTYDIELQTTASITLQNELTGDLQWLDNFHILNGGKNSYYYDYDGLNRQLFASNTLPYGAVLSNNNKYIYYFTSVQDGVELQRVSLVPLD